MKNYNHINKTLNNDIDFDYRDNIIKKTMPKRAFVNPLTSNIMLYIEAVFKLLFKCSDTIKNYKRI